MSHGQRGAGGFLWVAKASNLEKCAWRPKITGKVNESVKGGMFSMYMYHEFTDKEVKEVLFTTWNEKCAFPSLLERIVSYIWLTLLHPV